MKQQLQRLKTLYQKEFQYNAGVDAGIARVREIIEQAQESSALLSALHAEGVQCRLLYKNGFFWKLLAIYTLPAAAWAMMTAWLVKRTDTSGLMLLYLLPVAGFFWLLRFYRSNNARKELQVRALDVQEQLKYGFRNQTAQPGLEPDQMVGAFAHAFKRGNHSNEIRRHASGVLTHQDAEIPYTLFNYHYINKRKESHYESSKRRERDVYEHFDRWGIFVAGAESQGFALTSYRNRIYPQRWDTSSIEFNKKHHITGVSEIELARIFQPVNVLMFEQLLAGYREFELEVSGRLPVLYWGFDKDIFKRSLNGTEPQNAAQLAEQLDSLRLPNFEQLMQSLQPLLEKMVK